MDGLTCPHCGTVNPEDANFCKKCGANLHEDDAPAAATPGAESRDPDAPAADDDAGEEASPAKPPQPFALFDLGLTAPTSRPRRPSPA